MLVTNFKTCICAHCDQKFEAKRSDALTCSPACRMARARTRKRHGKKPTSRNGFSKSRAERTGSGFVSVFRKHHIDNKPNLIDLNVLKRLIKQKWKPLEDRSIDLSKYLEMPCPICKAKWHSVKSFFRDNQAVVIISCSNTRCNHQWLESGATIHPQSPIQNAFNPPAPISDRGNFKTQDDIREQHRLLGYTLAPSLNLDPVTCRQCEFNQGRLEKWWRAPGPRYGTVNKQDYFMFFVCPRCGLIETLVKPLPRGQNTRDRLKSNVIEGYLIAGCEYVSNDGSLMRTLYGGKHCPHCGRNPASCFTTMIDGSRRQFVVATCSCTHQWMIK